MIEIKNVSKSFGDNEVLQNADFTVENGSVLGLVGINGAGKSTLLRLVAGVFQADKGIILLDGKPAYENEEVKKKLFFLSDDPYYTVNVTGKQLAKLYSQFYSFDMEVFKRFMGSYSLDENKPIRNFSKGMKRQTFISLALACKPKYLLLDEAFDGLDPLARLEFKRGIIELQQEGSSVIIASHSLRELEDICDSFALLDSKRVSVSGKIDGELSKLIKLQLVFENDVGEGDFPFPLIHFEKTGRVIHIVAKGDEQEILEQINKMNPLIVDQIAMDFEDMFMYEVKSKGYLK